MPFKEAMKDLIPDQLLKVRRRLMYRREESLAPEKYPAELARWFKNMTGKDLDLESPTTFNEKINWLKLFDSTPEKGLLADKYRVRDYVAERVGGDRLVPLLGVWDDPYDIDFDALPNRFVLKATHGSGWNIIVHDKSKLDINATRETVREWLATDWAWCGGLELHYHFCEHHVVAESFLENRSGEPMWEYQTWCFGGKVKLVAVIQSPHGVNEKQFFSPGWEKMPFVSSPPEHKGEIAPPAFLSDLIELSERLAGGGFPFVRVDWYSVNGELFFSEMTFTPARGVVRWTPPEYDEKLGSLISLPAKRPYR